MLTEKSAKGRATAAVVMLAMACAAALPRIASAETVLRIGMTAADIPRTLGQPDQGLAGNRFTVRTLASARKIDDLTVELITKEPDSFLPINLTNLFMAGPSKWQKLFEAAEGADAKAKSQAAWTAFAKDPSGTGPWKMSSFTPRERLELVKNANYWDKARIPKVDKMLLLPMPEANARTAALLSGQVDWVEAPAPDAVAEIKQRGFNLYTNEEPHVWPWQFSRVEGSPWNDIRVRKAANLCIAREGLKEGLLAGLMGRA